MGSGSHRLFIFTPNGSIWALGKNGTEHRLAPKVGGRSSRYSGREILTAIVSLLRSGCAWRLLPHDLPPGKTVYYDFRLWRLQGG